MSFCVNRSNWLNKQRSLAHVEPISNFREIRKAMEKNNQDDSLLNTGSGKKKKRQPRRAVSEEIKTDDEILAGIDFSCLDTPRSAGD